MPVISTKVLTTTDQGLTELQKETARKNIDAIKKVDGVEGNIVTVGRDGEVQDSQVSIHVFRDVQADWADEAPDSPHHIKNKPEQLLADARVENDVLHIDKLYGGETVEFSGMSAEERRKLAGIEEGAQVNVVETVKVAGSALTPDENKAVDIPTATPSVKGVVKLATSVDSQEPDSAVTPGAVREALSHVGGYRVVPLGQDGKPDVPLADRSPNYIYLTEIPDTPDPDHYKEWIWEPGDPEAEPPVEAAWKCIGTTTPPLDDYIPKVANGTEGNLPGITSGGTLVDSGIAGSDVSAALTKLGGIENGAQANRIESITVNDGPTTIVNKNVNIEIPKAVPDPVEANQMLFSTDGATWAPVTWEIEDFDAGLVIGGKTYRTVKIGNLEWMAENLALPVGELDVDYRTYDLDGTDLYFYCGTSLISGNETMSSTFSALLPEGWRIPTNADFAYLASELNNDADSVKSTVTYSESDIGWDPHESTEPTDSTGMSVLAIPRYFYGNLVKSLTGTQCTLLGSTTDEDGRFYRLTLGNTYTYFDYSIADNARIENAVPVRLVKGTLPAGE